jgi:acetyltransferase-like isoleucine patch superfamily enzyme
LIFDHRPYFVKKTYRRFENFYVRHFLAPQLENLGRGFSFAKPWNVEIFGSPVSIGQCVHVVAAPDMKVRLSVWSSNPEEGYIRVGDYCLICPGVRISSAVGIEIENNCMLANGVYITDSDWHDIYNRLIPGSRSALVRIEENVWIGDGAIVCKGVTIGRNSIIGAGAVVTGDIPQNAIAAGNPARVVKRLDPEKTFVTRASWFSDQDKLYKDIDRLDKEMLKGNTIGHWLRHMFFPAKGE